MYDIRIDNTSCVVIEEIISEVEITCILGETSTIHTITNRGIDECKYNE